MKRIYLFLFIFSLLVSSIVAFYQPAPGYMDAEYYYLTGEQLAEGFGLEEPFIWNYLDSPSGLPHSSHTYWSPGISLLVYVGLSFSPVAGFKSVQVLFVILSAFIAPVTAALANRFNSEIPDKQKKNRALVSGLLAIFSGYYLGFLTTTDSFAFYMLLGGFLLLTVGHENFSEVKKAFILGLITGLMHLTRTDGLIWLFVLALIVWRHFETPGKSILFLLAGYLMVMTPWFFRNWQAFQTLMPPGGIRALWFTQYDDLFWYPSSELTFVRWVNQGAGTIGTHIIKAGWLNLQSLLAVGGGLFMLPLMGAGIRRHWTSLESRTAIMAWAAVFFLMTVLFPFAGARGGYFHAGAAFQPFLWATVPSGLEVFIKWGNRTRGWRVAEARQVFSIAILVFAMVISGYMMWNRVIQPEIQKTGPVAYAEAENFLNSIPAEPDSIVMVNNPPGYHLINRRPAIVIPTSGVDGILQAASRYDAKYLLLEEQQGLDALYFDPQNWPGLSYLGEINNIKVFEIEAQQ